MLQFIFANTPEGVRRNILILDQAKTTSRLLYFGPRQQLKAENVLLHVTGV